MDLESAAFSAFEWHYAGAKFLATDMLAEI
jgi:hypothetical protein